MTQKLVPMFLERNKKCAIINLSSQSIAFSVRNLSVYTGTKAFNDSFSKCLSQDYKGMFYLKKMSLISWTVSQLLSLQLEPNIPKTLLLVVLLTVLDGP